MLVDTKPTGHLPSVSLRDFWNPHASLFSPFFFVPRSARSRSKHPTICSKNLAWRPVSTSRRKCPDGFNLRKFRSETRRRSSQFP